MSTGRKDEDVLTCTFDAHATEGRAEVLGGVASVSGHVTDGSHVVDSLSQNFELAPRLKGSKKLRGSIFESLSPSTIYSTPSLPIWPWTYVFVYFLYFLFVNIMFKSSFCSQISFKACIHSSNNPPPMIPSS